MFFIAIMALGFWAYLCTVANRPVLPITGLLLAVAVLGTGLLALLGH